MTEPEIFTPLSLSSFLTVAALQLWEGCVCMYFSSCFICHSANASIPKRNTNVFLLNRAFRLSHHQRTDSIPGQHQHTCIHMQLVCRFNCVPSPPGRSFKGMNSHVQTLSGTRQRAAEMSRDVSARHAKGPHGSKNKNNRSLSGYVKLNHHV